MSLCLSVNDVAAKVHAAWLKERERSYSPFNRAWSELSAVDRAQISRQVRIVFDVVHGQNPGFEFIDEYVAPSPGDARWSDPIQLKAFRQSDQCSESPITHQIATSNQRHEGRTNASRQ